MDDILTFSGEPRAYLGHLAQVVQAHAAAGIKIQPCKTKLFQSQVEYLGPQYEQRRSFEDPGVCAEDQRLASTKEWKGGDYFLRIHRILSYLHTAILRFN